jgi:hypothetical protein
MDNSLTENERRTFDKFMRTDLGKKVLANIASIRQDFLDAAVRSYNQGQEFIHSQVSAAAGVDAVYYYLKPKKATEDEKAEE